MTGDYDNLHHRFNEISVVVLKLTVIKSLTVICKDKELLLGPIQLHRPKQKTENVNIRLL